MIQETVESRIKDEPSINFSVLKIPDWDEVLNEKSGIGPWDHIIQLDSEYTVEDGSTGGEVPAVSGVVQDKEETVGIFEIRPASGLVIGIDFEDIGIVHKIWTALDSIKRLGHGGSRREWWRIPLEYGKVADSLATGRGDSGSNKISLEGKDYQDVKDNLFKSSVLDVPYCEGEVYIESSGKFYFSSYTPSTVSDIHWFAQLLENQFVDNKRRNEKLETVFEDNSSESTTHD